MNKILNNNEMKISILTTSDYPYGGAGANFIREMVLGLDYNKVSVDVVRFWGDRYSNINDTPINCSNYIFARPFENELLKFIEFGIQILYIPIFVVRTKFFKQRNILVLFGIEPAYFVFPLTLFCRIFNMKCYRIIAEIFPENEIAPFWWRKPIIFFYRLQLEYFDKYLHGVIVLTNYLYSLCLKNGIKSNKMLLIPNFINLKKKYISISGGSPFIIGFCGIPSIENGIIDLLMAFKMISKEDIPNSQLIIIGSIAPDIRQKIEILNLDVPNIIFKGFLNKTEVENTYSICTVLINPRRTGVLAESGFPTKLGEYFATKKPVISTRVGDIKSYFTDKNELVFAEPNNPESIAQAIKYVFNNKEEAEIIGQNGYNWALKYLDSSTNSRKLIEFINLT
jgi:glycosyltransferase involved in cell wall biosynthesis